MAHDPLTRIALPAALAAVALHAAALAGAAGVWADRAGWTAAGVAVLCGYLAAARAVRRIGRASSWWMGVASAVVWLGGALLRDAAPLLGHDALTAADMLWCAIPLVAFAALSASLPVGWRALGSLCIDAVPLAIFAGALATVVTAGRGDATPLTVAFPAAWTLLALACTQVVILSGLRRAPRSIRFGAVVLWVMAVGAFISPALAVWDGDGGPAALLWSIGLIVAAAGGFAEARRPAEALVPVDRGGVFETALPVLVTVSFTLLTVITHGGERSLLLALSLLCFAGFSLRLVLLRRGSRRLLDELEASRAALAASEGRLRAIFAGARIGIGAADLDGRLFEVNPAFARMLGYEIDELVGRDLRDISHPGDAEATELLRRALDGEIDDYELEKCYVRKDGSVLHTQVNASYVRDAEGGGFTIGMVEDITERRRAQAELRNAEERYRTLVEEIPLVTYIDALDEQCSAVYMSPQVEALLGYTVEEWLEQPDLFVRLLHDDDRERVLAEHMACLASGAPFVCEYRLVARDGRSVWVHDESVPVAGPAGGAGHARGYLLDITARKEAEEQLQHLAYHDGLTGLPNRSLFREHLDLALSRATRTGGSVAVLYVDLDEFKLVNDSLGHSAGDELLREAARRLAECTRAGDVVARQGGDEFLVLLADVEHGEDAHQAARTVADAIRDVLAEPFLLSEAEIAIGASVGVSVFPDEAGDAESLLKQADIAMYQAKHSGRDGLRFHARSASDAQAQLSLVNGLRRAVVADEFRLHYQPIVDLVGGGLTGVEALIRWEDPQRGLIPPGDFIAVAERTGLIGPISEWVMEEACRQMARWRAQGLEIPVSVNIPLVLCDRRVVSELPALAERHGIAPHMLTVELTESTVMAAGGVVEPVLEELHARGVRVAIDDFGTGHSSLARLRDLPLSVLKIDRSFVNGYAGGGEADPFVATMVALAKNLGLVALAEGIETRAQWEMVLRSGGTLGQGFFFSPAVRADEITQMARRPSWNERAAA